MTYGQKAPSCEPITLTLAGLVGKVQKTISRRRKEGRVEKKAQAAHPRGLGLAPEGPQLHARGAV